MSLKQKFFFVLIAAITLFQASLGFWQWGRRGEKLTLIAGIERAAHAPAKPYAERALWDRVTITGQYLPEKTAYIRTSRPAPKFGERDKVGQVPVSGFGVLVLSAFRFQNCSQGLCRDDVVLVNRGFVPTPPNGVIPAFETPRGELQLTGFWRLNEREGFFPPKNDAAKGVFFFRSTQQIAQFLSLPGSPDLYNGFLDRQAEADETRPPFGVDVADFIKAIPNNHVEYAMTWWALALTNIVICFIFWWGGRAKRADKPKMIR
jgi:surfeit locus 1 family protein